MVDNAQGIVRLWPQGPRWWCGFTGPLAEVTKRFTGETAAATDLPAAAPEAAVDQLVSTLCSAYPQAQVIVYRIEEAADPLLPGEVLFGVRRQVIGQEPTTDLHRRRFRYRFMIEQALRLGQIDSILDDPPGYSGAM